MTSKPTVSVVIPAYNAGRWIGQTIGSVLTQTYTDFEIIVVDDGSTDSTRLIVDGLADQRIRCIFQENRGLSSARNTGIRAARGRYVALLDADDLFRPGKLEHQVRLLDSEPDLGLATCGFDLIDEHGQLLHEERPWLEAPVLDLRSLLFWNPLLPSTLLVRSTWFERAGLFDESLKRYEDWEFALRLAVAGCRMGVVQMPLLSYRRHATNMSTAPDLVPIATEAALGFLSRFFARADLPEGIRALEAQVYGNAYLDAAARSYGAGMVEHGREWLAAAVRYDPEISRGSPPRWCVSLCGYALGTLVNDWRQYVQVVCTGLPDREEFRGWTARRLASHVLATDAFRAHQMGRRTRARFSAARAILLQPAQLRNRGLIALAARPW